MRFRVNAPQVIHETIDHEVVIINLGTGTYYSLRGTGEEIWTLLDAGALTEQVVEDLAGRYETDTTQLADAVDTFVDQLLSESLVVADERAGEPVLGSLAAQGNGSRHPFEPPVLERFTEMQHLIALDPIHEVDERLGWPHT